MIMSGLCTCGHDQDEHIHRCAECTACECGVFADHDDLDNALNDRSRRCACGHIRDEHRLVANSCPCDECECGLFSPMELNDASA